MQTPPLSFILALGCLTALPLSASQTALPDAVAEEEQKKLSAEQIDELLAPIALYPDPLIAIILPAATFPTDIVLAARYLNAGKDRDAVEEQPWDDSVKALARYPEVVKWMDENLEWTQQVGAAFLLQPAAVLTGTQRLRAAAIAAGNLKDSPEQSVVVEKEVVRIIPAQKEIIYVPVYDPIWVYRPHVIDLYHPRPSLTFSFGYRTGSWLSYHCDWDYHTVVVINRPHRTVVWNTYPAWTRPNRSVVQHCHIWRPAPIHVRAIHREFHYGSDFQVPRPKPNAHVQHRPDRESPERNRSRNEPETARLPKRHEPRANEVTATTPPVPATPLPPSTPSKPDRIREKQRLAKDFGSLAPKAIPRVAPEPSPRTPSAANSSPEIPTPPERPTKAKRERTPETVRATPPASPEKAPRIDQNRIEEKLTRRASAPDVEIASTSSSSGGSPKRRFAETVQSRRPATSPEVSQPQREQEKPREKQASSRKESSEKKSEESDNRSGGLRR